MPADPQEPAGLPDPQEPPEPADQPAGGADPGSAGQPGRGCDHGSPDDLGSGPGYREGRDDGGGPPGLSWCWELDYEQLLAALDGRHAPRAGGDAASGEPATKGPAKKGPGKKGPGTNGPGKNGPGENGPGTNGPGKDGPGKDGPGKDAAAGDAAAEDARAGAGGGPGRDEDQDAVLDEILASEGRILSTAEVAGRVAEFLPPGPGLAGWLAATPAAGLDDGALAGVAASWRRLASWAQAGELAVVGQIAARAAARDKDIGVAADGRPARICADATGEICLALVMSQCGASWWADLAVTLSWRLARTGAALRDGVIDLSRARLIAEATSVLSEDAARAVEEKVLSRAGDQTLGQLRATLRRAVIIADPEGAERRREDAERKARVCLYPDDEGTATLAGQSLPGIRAAAAMARISAMARAMKASGAGGGIDLLRAQVFIGLLLGTLPYIPPGPDGLPDEPPEEPPDEPPDDPPDEPPDEPPDDGFGADPAGADNGEGQPRPGSGGTCPDSSAPPRGQGVRTGNGLTSRPGRPGNAGAASPAGRETDSQPPGPEPPAGPGPPGPPPEPTARPGPPGPPPEPTAGPGPPGPPPEPTAGPGPPEPTAGPGPPGPPPEPTAGPGPPGPPPEPTAGPGPLGPSRSQLLMQIRMRP